MDGRVGSHFAFIVYIEHDGHTSVNMSNASALQNSEIYGFVLRSLLENWKIQSRKNPSLSVGYEIGVHFQGGRPASNKYKRSTRDELTGIRRNI